MDVKARRWRTSRDEKEEKKMLSFASPCDRLVVQCKHRISHYQRMLSFALYRSTDRYRCTKRLILVTSTQEEHNREKDILFALSESERIIFTLIRETVACN
jgi:hypothetical protein